MSDTIEKRQELGRRIAGLRRVNRFTQQQLAEKMEMTRIAIAETEAGTRRVESIDLLLWCEALNVDIATLLNEPGKGIHRFHICAICGMHFHHDKPSHEAYVGGLPLDKP